jgi:ribosome biogenesis GTPase
MNKKNEKIKLEDLGYSDFFKNGQESMCLSPARVIAEHKELYIVRTSDSTFEAKITGKMIHEALSREDYPAVGDWVLIRPVCDEQALIYEILLRKTILKRKSANGSDIQIIASNIDTAFIVQSPDRDYSLNRFERYAALAEAGKIKPVMVLNKSDLISQDELGAKISELKNRFKDIEICTTSTVSGTGIEDLKKELKKGTTYCFLGSSGVGKSSLINSLLGEAQIKTGKISVYSDRGKHITTHRQLFILESGGLLIDNPGMRQIGILDAETGIKSIFSEFQQFSAECRYPDCTHQHEPGCAVLEALRTGKIEQEKYDNYMRLEKENQFNTMSKLEKREKERKFGKFMKTTKKLLKKYKPYR